MGMSDEAYQKIVAELKASKQHLPGRRDEPLHRTMHGNVVASVFLIGAQARSVNGYQKDGPYASEILRAETLHARTLALSILQVTSDLHDIVESGFRRLTAMSVPSPEDFDRALAEIQVGLELAERRAA